MIAKQKRAYDEGSAPPVLMDAKPGSKSAPSPSRNEGSALPGVCRLPLWSRHRGSPFCPRLPVLHLPCLPRPQASKCTVLPSFHLSLLQTPAPLPAADSNKMPAQCLLKGRDNKSNLRFSKGQNQKVEEPE